MLRRSLCSRCHGTGWSTCVPVELYRSGRGACEERFIIFPMLHAASWSFFSSALNALKGLIELPATDSAILVEGVAVNRHEADMNLGEWRRAVENEQDREMLFRSAMAYVEGPVDDATRQNLDLIHKELAAELQLPFPLPEGVIMEALSFKPLLATNFGRLLRRGDIIVDDLPNSIRPMSSLSTGALTSPAINKFRESEFARIGIAELAKMDRESTRQVIGLYGHGHREALVSMLRSFHGFDERPHSEIPEDRRALLAPIAYGWNPLDTLPKV